VDCTPKLRQQEALHFAAKGLQSGEEEKERAVCAGVPAIGVDTNISLGRLESSATALPERRPNLGWFPSMAVLAT
jgi:hypothetical protein